MEGKESACFLQIVSVRSSADLQPHLGQAATPEGSQIWGAEGPGWGSVLAKASA